MKRIHAWLRCGVIEVRNEIVVDATAAKSQSWQGNCRPSESVLWVRGGRGAGGGNRRRQGCDAWSISWS